jgi:hypothetical protein
MTRTKQNQMQATIDYQRAAAIEAIVCRDYLDADTDAADIALEEIQRNPDRSDDTIAHVVAMRVVQS